MLFKSELREVLGDVLKDHLEGTDAEEVIPDIVTDILDKCEDRFQMEDDEVDDVEG